MRNDEKHKGTARDTGLHTTMDILAAAGERRSGLGLARKGGKS
jgi:hypothetical protein